MKKDENDDEDEVMYLIVKWFLIVYVAMFTAAFYVWGAS
jgi:hypothetical protein